MTRIKSRRLTQAVENNINVQITTFDKSTYYGLELEDGHVLLPFGDFVEVYDSIEECMNYA